MRKEEACGEEKTLDIFMDQLLACTSEALHVCKIYTKMSTTCKK